MAYFEAPKPYRKRALRGWYRTLNETLREKVRTAAETKGMDCPPDDTTGFIRIASSEAPGLLRKVRQLQQLMTQDA